MLNKDSKTIKYKYVDDVRVYQFIEEIKALSANNNIKEFETASNITRYLKEQFAGLFQRFLEEQIRMKEVSIISNLEKTAQTLNKLVNYLSDENKDQAEEINKILKINHPLVQSLRETLDIPYNFYVEGYEDLNQLLVARGMKREDEDEYDEWLFDSDYYHWSKSTIRKLITLKISRSIFDEEGRLKFFKKTDWNDEYFQFIENEKITVTDDDLPF